MRIPSRKFSSVVSDALIGKRCWYVVANSFPPAFELALGKKVKRAESLKIQHHSRGFRIYEGEANLMVWSAWRLQRQRRVISTSEDIESRATRSIESIVGATILAVTVSPPANDMVISFDTGVVLHLFCERVGGRMKQNWEIFAGQKTMVAGPGSQREVCDRP